MPFVLIESDFDHLFGCFGERFLEIIGTEAKATEVFGFEIE